jgi:hypothetical protein
VALRNCSPPKELLHGRGLNLPRVRGADLVFLGIGEHPFRTNCQVEESISDVIHGGDEGPARTREGDRTQRSWATSPVSPLAIANSADPDHFSPGGIPLVWRAHGMC